MFQKISETFRNIQKHSESFGKFQKHSRLQIHTIMKDSGNLAKSV
jgi:hypothetical protein